MYSAHATCLQLLSGYFAETINTKWPMKKNPNSHCLCSVKAPDFISVERNYRRSPHLHGLGGMDYCKLGFSMNNCREINFWSIIF